MLSWRYPPIGVSIHPLHGNLALQGLLYSLTVTDHGGKFFPPNPLIEIVPQNRQGFFVSGSVQGIPFSFSPARVSPTTYRPHLLTFMWWKHYHTNKERQEYPTSELVSCLFVLFSFSRFRPCPCLFVLTLEPLHRLSENISHAATFCYGCPSQVLILLQCQPKTDILVAFCWWPSPPVYLSRLSSRVPSDERPAPQKRTSPISEKVSCTACTKKIFYLPKHFPHCGDIKNSKQRKKTLKDVRRKIKCWK